MTRPQWLRTAYRFRGLFIVGVVIAALVLIGVIGISRPMPPGRCAGPVCFMRLDATAPRFFGFAECLTALALLVLAWTTTDARYRFRIQVAPLPLKDLTFWSVVGVSTLALLTDLWRSEQWLVPRGRLLTPASWQALLGLLLLSTVLLWAWFAFIRPPVFSTRNADRFAHALYRVILKGAPEELAVVGDEVAASVSALIRYAPERRTRTGPEDGTDAHLSISPVEGYANDILLLIADRRFCRALVDTSPATILRLFDAIGDTKKYGVAIGSFGRNVVSEALANRNSFLFHETEGYSSGLIGYHKPLSRAMFADARMVEEIGTLLDPDFSETRKWDPSQWSAFCRITLMTLSDHVSTAFWNHSFVLHRAIDRIKESTSDLYKLSGSPTAWDADALERLRVVVEFFTDAVTILNERGVPEYLPLRVRDNRALYTIYDQLAEGIADVIFAAAAVRSPADFCWMVQHNMVWAEFFGFGKDEGAASRVIQFKVRRLIYNDVTEMTRFPNYKGARYLGLCLNVLGLRVREEDYFTDSRPLHRAILSWTKRHFAWLHDYNSRVADACLVDRFSYDAGQLRIVKTYPAEGLQREATYDILTVDPPTKASGHCQDASVAPDRHAQDTKQPSNDGRSHAAKQLAPSGEKGEGSIKGDVPGDRS